MVDVAVIYQKLKDIVHTSSRSGSGPEGLYVLAHMDNNDIFIFSDDRQSIYKFISKTNEIHRLKNYPSVELPGLMDDFIKYISHLFENNQCTSVLIYEEWGDIKPHTRNIMDAVRHEIEGNRMSVSVTKNFYRGE